ncbi:D-alanyl-D-alanine carboxypeptidase [Kushneria pakistanensis]|uniref:D-alanyl-D-alanine carboxypeptidase n=1 Tax=Kushneria pakistanensis TaxID=1508770 RepID=A0ABQ3FJN9_9GAMM|nr:D-alanyl-D-alanine carboxypeptidase/D-alanyl-D-alanine-endopeptidase [Kushneria pakistanensis]GHC26973.1 D-alanyl-D-alanine carboxypeptidase [Kushneria pakistanensis]
MLLVLATALAASARADGFPATRALVDKGFLVGAQARLLDSGESLGSIAPDQQMTPASVSKLYTAAAALKQWGPQKRFTTELRSDGAIVDGVLKGDLILDGGGDPGMTSEDYWLLVQGLAQRGIRRIDGRVLASQWRFGPVPCVTTDRCNARMRTRHAFDAQLTSTAVDFATWCARVMPGDAEGVPARVTSCTGPTPLTRVDNRVITVAQAETGISAERTTANGEDTMVVSGQVRLGSAPSNVYRSSADPAVQTLKTLASLMENAGIAVTQGYATTSTRPGSTTQVLSAVEGKPLQEQLLRMLNYSNNFMADVLALNLVSGAPSMQSAGAALDAFATSIPGHGPVSLRSGSGLTPESHTSASGVTALLDDMYHQSALFPVFVAGMQTPVNGPMNFIRRGSQRFQQNVMIKTGTLNEPVPVRAVAGYFRTLSGRWGAFTVMVNGRAPTPYINWTTTLEAVASDVDAMIAGH